MKIITANLLLEGDVVWLGAGNIWVGSVQAAKIFSSQEELGSALKVAEASVVRREVVEPYALEVTQVNGVITPTTIKERIRTQGPTIRRDLGKQSEKLNQVA